MTVAVAFAVYAGAVCAGAICAGPWLTVRAIAADGASPQGRPAKAERDQQRMAAGNLVGHGGPIKAIATDASGRFVATGGFDYAAMVWDVSGELPTLVARLDAHGGAVNAVAFVPVARVATGIARDGESLRLLTAADDGVVTLWDVTLWDVTGAGTAATGAVLKRFEGHAGKVSGLAVSEDGRFAVSAGWDRTARVWDLGAKIAGPVLEGHQGPVNAAQFSADGATVYTASYDGTIGIYERATGKAGAPLVKNGWGVNVLKRMAGGELLVYGGLNGHVGIVDGAGRTEARDLKGHDRPVLGLALVEKPGLIATGGGDGVVRVMRASDGAVLEEFKNPYGPVWAMAFVASGTKMYLGGLDDFATLWQVAPRAPFEHADTDFPRRFQKSGSGDSELEIGELQFARKCSVCHTLTPDGANRAGPTLHGVFGRRIATLPGYTYSAPLKDLDLVWSADTIGKLFELGPDVVTPGSKMPLQRITEKRLRDALVAYLKVSTGAPVNEKTGVKQ